jgi:hypothetical protein
MGTRMPTCRNLRQGIIAMEERVEIMVNEVFGVGEGVYAGLAEAG